MGGRNAGVVVLRLRQLQQRDEPRQLWPPLRIVREASGRTGRLGLHETAECRV